MSYEHRSNLNRNKISTSTKLVVLFGIIIVILNVFFPYFLSSIFIKVFNPFWGKVEKQGISVELKDAMINELLNENAQLKGILGRNTASSTIIAYILKKPPYTAYDSYIIDIGNDNNVKVGNKVFSIGNVLLGEIVEVNSDTSKVKLYSSFGEKFNVNIGKSIQTTAIGKGGGTFEVILPRDTDVKEGDTVIVPDIHTSVFGMVQKVIIDPAKTFYTVLFSQPVNIYEQKMLLIENRK